MPLKSEYFTGQNGIQIGPQGRYPLPLSISGAGRIIQVNIGIDGQSNGAAQGSFAILYDNTPPYVYYPSPQELLEVQGDVLGGVSRVRVWKRPGWSSHYYRYYVSVLSSFNSSADIVLYNPDPYQPANFYCIVLYEIS